MNLINEAVVGFADPAEQEVLIALSALSKVAPSVRERRQLLEERTKLEREASGLEEETAFLYGAIKAADEELLGVWKQPAIIALFAGGLVAVVLGLKFSLWVSVVGLVVVILGVLRLQKAKAEPNAKKLTAEKKRAGLDGEIQGLRGRIGEIAYRLETEKTAFPSVAIARVAFALEQTELMGRNCLIDQSGIRPNVSLRTVDLDAVGDGLGALSAAAAKIADVPVLLSSRTADEGLDPIDRLYGEESDFKAITNDYGHILGKVKDVTLDLPLIESSNVVAQAFAIDSNRYPAPEHVWPISTRSDRAVEISGFVQQVNKAAAAGQSVMVSLNITYEALLHVGQLYSSFRSESVHHVHQEIFEVLNRASWCSKRFFCPRSIQSPTYIQDLIEVPVEEAHQLEYADLLSRLRRDKVIADRISSSSELLEQLRTSHRAVRDFDPSNAGVRSDDGVVPVYIENQFQEALRQFVLTLTTMMFGSSRPLLNLSEESQLYYDPETDQWSSDLIPHVYSTGQVQKYGQILKIRNDLFFPIWEHLWIEKADFRKSEMFRTNESLIRMTEKESEKIIEVGNQFRSDMRTVREHVHLIESEISSKRTELQAFQSSMGSLNMLSEQQLKMLNEGLSQFGTMAEKPILKDAEERESWLTIEPQNQAMRRGTVADPLSIAKIPSILISYGDTTVARLGAPTRRSENAR